MVKISEEEGTLALWNGCMASLVLVSNPTIQFVVYDKIKSIFTLRATLQGRSHLNGLEIFIIGAIAKAVATVLTYPIQLAQSRMRAHKTASKEEGKKNQDSYTGTLDCLIKIFRKDGFFGWFRGLFVKLLQTVLTAAFQFMTYEYIARMIFTLLRADTKNVKLSDG